LVLRLLAQRLLFSLQLCDVSYGEPLLLAQRWWLQQARQPVQQLR
jgi:hypothetical protein